MEQFPHPQEEIDKEESAKKAGKKHIGIIRNILTGNKSDEKEDGDDWINKEVLNDAKAAENFHKKRLGEDYE